MLHIISSWGYLGVAIMMAISSAAIPLPSELFLPFSGFLIHAGRFSLFGVAFASSIGAVGGSLILYCAGYYGGRPFIEKHAKYFLMSKDDIAKADRFFEKYGDFSNFIGRLLPIVRSFISLPAGIYRSEIKRFIFYTFLGSFIWSFFLAWIGMELGDNWVVIQSYFHQINIVLAALIALGICYFIYRHVRRRA